MWRAPPWGPSEERMRAMSRSLSRRRRLNRRSPNARGGGAAGGKGRGGGGGRSATTRASLQRLRRRHAQHSQHSRRRKGVRGGSGHRATPRHRSPKAKHRGGGGSGGGGAGGGAWVATSRGSARAPQSPRVRGSSLRQRPPPGARCGRGRSSRSRRRGKSHRKSSSRRQIRSGHLRQSHMGSARSLPSLIRSMSRSRLKSVRGSTRRLSPQRNPSPGCGGSPTTRSASSTRGGGSPGRRTSRQRNHSVGRLVSPRYKNRRRRHYARLRSSQSRRRRRVVSRSHTSSASHSTSPSPATAAPTSPAATALTALTAGAAITASPEIENIGDGGNDNNEGSINNDTGADSPDNDPDKANRDCLSSLASSSPSLLFRSFRRPMCPGERPGSPITAVASLQSIMETQKRASQAFILPARSATHLPCIALPAPPPVRSPKMPHAAGQAFIPGPPPAPPLPQEGPPPQMPHQLQQMKQQAEQQEQMQQQLGGTVTVQRVLPLRGGAGSRERASRKPSLQSVPTQRPSGYSPGLPGVAANPYATHPYLAAMQVGPQTRAESPPAQKARGSDVVLQSAPNRLKGGRTSETRLDGTAVYERELFYGDDTIKQPCVPGPGMIIHPPQTASNRIHPHGAGFYFGPPAPPQVSPEALAAAKAHAARIAAARAEALRKMADAERERDLATPPTTSSSTVTGSTCRPQNAASRGRKILREQRTGPTNVPVGGRPMPGRPPGYPRAPRPQTTKLQNPLLIGTANPMHPDPVVDRRSPSTQPTYPSSRLGTAHPLYSMAVASTWHLDSAKATAQRSLAALSSPPPPAPPVVGSTDSTSCIERATVSSRSKASHSSRMKRHNKAQVSSSANMAPSKPTSRQKGRRKDSAASGHPQNSRDQGQTFTAGKNTSKHNHASKKRSEAMKFSGDHHTGKGFSSQKQWGKAQREPQVVFEHKGSVWTQWTTPTQGTGVPPDSSTRRPFIGRVITQPPTMRPVVPDPLPRSTPLHWLPTPRQSPSAHRLSTSSPSASSTDNQKLSATDKAPGGGDAMWRTYYYEEQLFTPTIPLPTLYG